MKLAIDGRGAYAYTGGVALDATRPGVVLIHGALLDHSAWSLQARALAHHGRAVLAVDLPGHGRSAGPALASVEALGDWVVALLDAAGLPSAAIVGHSMGALIALEAAARLGPRATRLVLAGIAYPMKVAPALMDTARDTPALAIDRVNAYSHSTLAAKPSSPGPGVWLHGANRALMRRTQAAYAAAGHGNLFHHDFGLCDGYAGALQAAARVTCPVGFLVGERDQMTLPKAAGELAAALRAEVRTLPAGHALMQEAPDATQRALAAWL